MKVIPVINMFLCEGSDIDDYIPETSNFAVPVLLLVGPEKARGSEHVQVIIASVEHVRQKLKLPPYVWPGHGTVIVDEWDVLRIKEALTSLVSACRGKNWTEVGLKLTRVGEYEFEEDFYQ